MGGPEDPKCLRRNPQFYHIIDARFLDHVWRVGVASTLEATARLLSKAGDTTSSTLLGLL